MRVAYVDGRYRPLASATVSVEDRGFQFADSVYEVAKALGGRLYDLDRHLARLERSLAALQVVPPWHGGALRVVLGEALRRSRLRDALVYIQVSRGAGPRNHAFPRATRATLVVTVRPLRLPSPAELRDGVGVVLRRDERWARCDIKSVGLLANVLAKQAAVEAGCREAWLVDADGRITEGASTNAWIVDAAGRLRTRPAEPAILGGVTREVVLELAGALAIPINQRAFDRDDLVAAAEAFLTSTTSGVLPVVRVDGVAVGAGVPGPVTRRLMRAYAERFAEAANPTFAAVRNFA